MITKEIYQIGGSGFTAPEDAAVYLIHPDLLSDQAAYQDSLKKMLELNADILCEGHYGIFNGKTAVREFISSFMV